METISCELKYCEGCGTLKLRPINFVTNHCAICEHMLARFRFPRTALAGKCAGLPIELPRRKVPPSAGGTREVREGTMSDARIVLAGSAVSRETKKARCMTKYYDGARADVLFFRAQALGYRPPLL